MKPADQPDSGIDYSQPAGFDVDGRPLYLHPPIEQGVNSGAAPPESSSGPADSGPDDEAMRRHKISNQYFPDISLHTGEYVITMVERHPLGIISIWVSEVIVVLMIIAAWVYLLMNPGLTGGWLDNPEVEFGLFLATLALVGFMLLIGWLGTVIYQGNRFFVTDQRVIQFERTGLFARRRKTIILGGVEDVRYRQNGILQMMLNYGSIRLSTVGDETTYPFTIVRNPKEQTRVINEAVIAHKSQRPIPGELLDPIYRK